MTAVTSAEVIDGDGRLQAKEEPAARATWADLCRVCSIYGVILIHSCAAMFYSFGKAPLGNWLAANALDSIARVSVPLFVMLSGAMLLKPGAPIVSLASVLRRIGKVLIPLVVWTTYYLHRDPACMNEPIACASSTLRQPAMYHLWFVYMTIGIYLLLPFLQAIYERIRSQPRLIWYFLAIWIAITCLPAHFPIPLLNVIQQPSFLGYGGYFIAGALLAGGNCDRVPTLAWFGLYAASSLATFLLTWYFSDKAGAPVEAAYVYFTLNVAVAALAAFKIFTRLNVGPLMGKILRWISERSFVIYFVHVVLLEQVRYSGIIDSLSHSLPAFFIILIISLLTFVYSLVIAALIRLIPGADRVVG